ncbi:hypothetical protein M472_19185 [Sphingobacterium paucimobilis HER1398]|uniref:Uncharacterized protein n=1 Tax=Sphingobacterium paucimobilis HER1398 TaxID=1346330 RepID=U2HZ96_9SPHI|nr:hypothetical protein M472_19185 [Sphingobacterium paucimobilis HER1398]
MVSQQTKNYITTHRAGAIRETSTKKGDAIKLKGRSVFEFDADGKIHRLTDIAQCIFEKIAELTHKKKRSGLILNAFII